MKKLLKATILSITAALSIQAMCHAIDFVPDGQMYTISGNAGEVSSHMLSVNVKSNEALAHTSYVLTSDAGDFSYSFMLPEDAAAGKYTVRLTDSDRGEIYSYDFVYADENKKTQIITALNSAAKAEAAKDALNECVDFSMYTYPTSFELTAEILNSVYEKIAKTNDFSAENITDKLREIFAVASLCNAADENIDKILTEYRQVYQFENEKYYSLYITFDDADTVNKLFLKNKPDDLLQIRKVFNEITVLHKMCGEESPGGIVNIINDCSDIFPESVIKLSKDDKLKLGTLLLGKTINTMSEIETAVSDMKSNNESGSNTNSGTNNKNPSKSSGGSGFSSGIAPSVKRDTGEILKSDFADLKDAEWAREAVYALSNKEIINGYNDGDFRPNNNITREEFVKIVVCAFKLNTFGSGNSFADVPRGHWAESYISSASRSGIAGGIGNGEFGLGKNITRQDMAVILYNALEVSGKAEAFELGESFSDSASIADYAKKAVNALKSYEILAGYTDGTFLPQNNATRAEAAQLIYKVLQLANLI